MLSLLIDLHDTSIKFHPHIQKYVKLVLDTLKYKKVEYKLSTFDEN